MQEKNDLPTALDDIHLMEKLDQSDMYSYLPSLIDDTIHIYEQAKKSFTFKSSGFQNIVGAGMGGSGQPLLAVKSLFKQELTKPFIISQDYTIPEFVDSNTLFVAISHSGNTEEIIDQYRMARSKGAQLVVIATGGTLLSMAQDKVAQDKVASVSFSTAHPPRASFGFMFGALLACLEYIDAIPDSYSALQEADQVVKKLLKSIRKGVLLKNNRAKKMACDLQSKIPLIYVEPPFDAIGARFTKNLNENAKRFAFYNCFPELRHNEIMCWTSSIRDIPQQFLPIFIRDNKQHSSMELEINLVRGVMREYHKDAKLQELRAHGNTKLARFYSLLCMTDMISYYEAILMKEDPISTIELSKLKETLRNLNEE